MSLWRRFARFFNAETIILDNKAAWKRSFPKLDRARKIKLFQRDGREFALHQRHRRQRFFTLSSYAHSFDDTAGLALLSRHIGRGCGATGQQEKA
jgi:hypothetical protein